MTESSSQLSVIWLGNPQTADPRVLQMLAVMEDSSVGVVAPSSARAWFSRAEKVPRYQSFDEAAAFVTELEASGTRSMEQLVLDTGCFLVRRAALEAAGGFDPVFATMHYGLPDFCLRLRTAGWGVRFVPSAYVHEAAASEAELGKADAAAFRAKYGFDCMYSCNTRPELLEHVKLPEAGDGTQQAPAVLEIGCACGGNLLRLRSERPDVELYGIELSEASATVARQFAQVYALDVEDFHMPEWDGRFDAVICGDLLEHLRDPWKTVQNLCRITRPGGRLIISVPNVMHISNLYGMLREGNWAYEAQGIRDRTHLRFFTQRTARELVEQGGYHTLTVLGRAFRISKQQQELREQLLPILGPGVTDLDLDALQWIVVGEKENFE